ncbi:MAG: hypothetical protein LUH03_03765 [Oscillospiraceae bacterium]|nr:hypothetical protein [Oscillospiraceae bacterium]
MREIKNADIRDEIKRNGLTQWEVAEQAGIKEITIYRWLRTDLTPEHRAILTKAIEELKACS